VADDNKVEQQEEGVDVPYQQIDPETLSRMIQIVIPVWML